METQQREKGIREVLFNEVSLTIAIVSIAIGIFSFISNPAKENELEIAKLRIEFSENVKLSQQIQNLKDNDLHTLEQKSNDLQNLILEVNENVIRLQTIIEERIPKE